MANPETREITELLAAWSEGDETAFEQLVPVVYAELKRLARGHMYRENEGHVLQTTALVHEAYLKLAAQKNAKWENRVQFFAVSSQQMRRILVDSARSRLRHKRGADAEMVPLEDAPALSVSRAEEFIALDDALKDLEGLDPRRSRVVEMRYFGGMNAEETAAALNISTDTVMRDWKAAKAWLHAELSRVPGGQFSALGG